MENIDEELRNRRLTCIFNLLTQMEYAEYLMTQHNGVLQKDNEGDQIETAVANVDVAPVAKTGDIDEAPENNEPIYEEVKPVTTVMVRIASRMSSMRKWMRKQLSTFCCFCQH